MQKLLIIDGHAILYRAFHAMPPLTTSSGANIGAVYGFISILLRTVNDIRPKRLIVVFDRPEPTFRNKLFKNYQIQRPKAEDIFISQVEIIHSVLKSMGIAIYEQPGYEADDVIGTAVTMIVKEKEEWESIIVTGDRDILQLVNGRVKVLMPVKGLSQSKLYGEKEVLERMEVEPSEIPDLKGLVGDQSDNYPGVSGIGPKTAVTLIRKYKTIEEIYNNIEEIEGKVKTKLLTGRESAFLSKKLAIIVRDVPVKIDWKRCENLNFDRPDIRDLFEKMEFRSLIPRLSGSMNQELRIKNKKVNNEVKKPKSEQTSLF